MNLKHAPEPDPLPTREVTEVVYGYRAWITEMGYAKDNEATAIFNREMFQKDYTLIGATGMNWKSSEMIAKCGTPGPLFSVWPDGSHSAPALHCRCGIYCYNTLNEALYEAREWGGGEVVVGRVVIDGTCIKHEKGYRAGHATIDRLWVLDTSNRGEETSKALALKYGVPCETMEPPAPLLTEDVFFQTAIAKQFAQSKVSYGSWVTPTAPSVIDDKVE